MHFGEFDSEFVAAGHECLHVGSAGGSADFLLDFQGGVADFVARALAELRLVIRPTIELFGARVHP